MGTTPWSDRGQVLEDPDSPAVYVSWNDAQDFITALNQLGQGRFRLPTEAEWEYACRAETTTRFYWGDDPNYIQINDNAWYSGNKEGDYAHVVGQKLPNAFGLYDMSGNVMEWCQDFFHDNYTEAPTDGSAWESPSSPYRVHRGGAWYYNAQSCRSAYRCSNNPNYTFSSSLGFRLVRISGDMPTETPTPTLAVTPTITPKPGDINLDGSVNTDDLIIQLDNFMNEGSEGDMTGEGILNYEDLFLFSTEWEGIP
jgi:hypothetical protein